MPQELSGQQKPCTYIQICWSYLTVCKIWLWFDIAAVDVAMSMSHCCTVTVVKNVHHLSCISQPCCLVLYISSCARSHRHTDTYRRDCDGLSSRKNVIPGPRQLTSTAVSCGNSHHYIHIYTELLHPVSKQVQNQQDQRCHTDTSYKDFICLSKVTYWIPSVFDVPTCSDVLSHSSLHFCINVMPFYTNV